MRGVTVAELEAWAEAGAHWRVESDGERVELCACTGETVEVRPLADAAVRAFLTRYPDDERWSARVLRP